MILITGGYGCIGAETAKWLIRNSDTEIVICSRKVSDERTERVFHGVDQSRMVFVQTDVTDQAAVQSILVQHRVTQDFGTRSLSPLFGDQRSQEFGVQFLGRPDSRIGYPAVGASAITPLA